MVTARAGGVKRAATCFRGQRSVAKTGTMLVAALQFDVRRGATASNTEVVLNELERAAERGIALVVLPEMWPSSFPGPESDLAALVAADDDAWTRVAQAGARLGVSVCGSAFGGVERGLPANRWRLFDAGECRSAYDKLHLFSPTAENESFSAGDRPPACVELRGARVSGLVCYDLRFPELTRLAFRAAADLVCISAQWPVARAANWRALAAGLAAQNQCFVVACNRTGVDVIGRRELTLEFPGNSLLVDPHGRVLAEGRGENGLIEAELDLALARDLRRRVPVERDQRSELYARWSREPRG